MSELELDAGNTKVKWRLRERTSVLDAGAVATRDSDWLERLLGQLEGLAGVIHVRIASVRGQMFNESLRLALRERFAVEPGFARVSAYCAGVTNGYMDPARMGVDRWLAILAAWHELGCACVVVDAGSALTVDIVDAAGQHRGGYIVPGLGMMLSALQDRSQALQWQGVPQWAGVEPGCDTRAAIENGLLAMVTGWLSQQGVQLPGHRWLVTGGDGDTLLPYLGAGAELRPALVLDGLALAFS